MIVTPASATISAANGLASHVPKERPGDTGKGEANYAATWDEFPNGRFGDVNSPAFGTQDLWGGFGRVVSTTSSDCHRSTVQAHRIDTEWPTSEFACGYHYIERTLPLWRDQFVSILPRAAFQRVTAYPPSPASPGEARLVARRLAACRRWLTFRRRDGRVGPRGRIRVSEAICRVFCERGGRGQVRRRRWDGERRGRLLSGESCCASELSSTSRST